MEFLQRSVHLQRKAILRYLLKQCRFNSSNASNNFNQSLAERNAAIKEAGTWKDERVITSKQGPEISVQGSQNRILNFCANNYLGLSSHPEVINAGKNALDKYGAGLSSVRFICGTQDIHKELENKIAQFHGREDAILYPSCFDANAGLFEAILEPEDVLISDELNHASIIDGVRLCKAKKLRYKHRDMKDLESMLSENKDARTKLIVTDGVFSMDGNVAPLRDIVSLADKYEAIIFVDECHATGFFGKTGRGTEEFFGYKGRVDIINSTLGKALGGAAGGYTTGSKELIALLRQKSRPYLFSNTLPPPVVACASKVFDLLMDGTDLTTKVAENTKLFRDKMTEAGFTIAGEDHPICPVMLGDARLAVEFADEMLKRDIYVIGFTFPVVPVGKSRIRVQISASHSREDIEKCINAFIEVGKKKGVIN
ncbi:2-amino-3-ketobutyrate coenzyme A ligase, mitochondrial-like [Dendronephthya gigantea]|uniref:2-amino-3-ketobutyrate coenzyme A ligase, mitochondrial-like n=1 Tax=Dendronephthya gigantea TaxID=151771 RepID=UPI00106D2C05|nr:2-amino-3-ketobutyrate coenzyme A ligase, mitochondrial-like [Dendronephthya gigantea]